MKKTITKLIFIVALGLLTVNANARSFIPQVTKTITSNETIWCTDITGVGDPATSWVTMGSYGTTGSKYTNTTNDLEGNPTGIVDNIESISENALMIQIKADGGVYNSGKRVIHMNLKGVSGVIVHGFAQGENRGLTIGYHPAETAVETSTMNIAAQYTRPTGGSMILEYQEFDPEETYIISIFAATNDARFYAVELIHALNPGISSFKVGEYSADIDDENLTINLTLPYGADITNLTPEVNISLADDYAPKGPQDFSTSKTYTVLDSEENILKTYTVNITTEEQQSSDATLKNLTIDGKTVQNFASDTLEYNVNLPYSLELPVVAAEENDPTATIDPIVQLAAFPGTVNVNVTAQDGTVMVYKINFTQTPASEQNAITTFTINNFKGVIDEENKTISVVMHSGVTEAADLASLTPTVKVSEFATYVPEEAADFSNGTVDYTVTSQSGVDAVYKVSVSIADLTFSGTLPYETTFPAEYELEGWMHGNVSFNGAYASSDKSLWVEEGEENASVVRINGGNDKVNFYLPKCGTFEVGLSATGGRTFVLYVNGEEKANTGSIKSGTKTTLTYNVNSAEPVTVTIENVGTGGATMGSLKIGDYELPNSLQEVASSGIAYINGIVYNTNKVELSIYSLDGKKLLVSSENVDMSIFKAGIYIVTSAEGYLKIAK